jgi:hypothetical protein
VKGQAKSNDSIKNAWWGGKSINTYLKTSCRKLITVKFCRGNWGSWGFCGPGKISISGPIWWFLASLLSCPWILTIVFHNKKM